MSDIRISRIMQTEFPRLPPEAPIRDAAALMIARQVASAPVVDDSGRLIGILSQKDCFRPALNASYYQQWQGRVADQMSVEVRTLEADADLVSAAEAFLEQPFHSFPVLRTTELVGMLTRADLLGAFLRHG